MHDWTALTLIVAIWALPLESEETLEFARCAHRANVLGLRQFTCKVECTLETRARDGSLALYRKNATYWRDGERTRAVQTDSAGNTRDCFTHAGILRILDLAPDRRTATGSLTSIDKHDVTDCDAFAHALLCLPFPNRPASVSLEQLFDAAGPGLRCTQGNIARRDYVTLKFEVPANGPWDLDWSVTIHLDPHANYLVSSVTLEHQHTANSDEIVRKYSAQGFQEVSPAIYFPTSAIAESWVKGKLLTRRTTRFREITVNQPLPADAFAFSFPHGLMIGDQVRGVRYQVDHAGRQISQEEPIVQGLATVGIAPALLPSAAEPTSWFECLPHAFGALFVAIRGGACAEQQPSNLMPNFYRFFNPVGSTRVCIVVGSALLAALGSLVLVNSTFWTSRIPVLSFTESVDLGERERGDVVEAQVTVANRGTGPLTVNNVRTSCACSGLERKTESGYRRVETLTLTPGQGVDLVVRLAVNAPAESAYRTAIEFQTNDVQRPHGRIELLNPRVKGGVSTVPSSIAFGTVALRGRAIARVAVWDTAEPPRKLVSITSSNPERVRAAISEPDGTCSGKQEPVKGRVIAWLDVELTTDIPGEVNETLRLQPAGTVRAPDVISVTGRVAAPFEATPPLLTLPRNTSDGLVYSHTCELRSVNGEPFEVTVDQCAPGLTVHLLNRGTKQDRHFARITWDGTWRHAGTIKTDEAAVHFRCRGDNGTACVVLPVFCRRTRGDK
jgi:hypothetical protein